MLRFDESSAECLVFTFKEGLLAAAAHDLKIRVTRFTLEVEEQARTVDARFDPRSLRVVCAMDGAAESPGTLTDANRAEIESNLVRYVLEPDSHPEIRFVSSAVRETGEGFDVEGTLELHGLRRPLRVPLRRDGDAYVAEVAVHQPDFAIRPYSALLGAIRVQADVRVRVTVRHPA